MVWMYILVVIVLAVSMLFYFRIADKYNIIDKPNQRSSHTSITIRGGGILFPLAMLLFYIGWGIRLEELRWLYILTGTLAISAVSFWDDVSSLPNKVRITVHLLAVTLLLYALGIFASWPIWIVPLVYILIIGTINAYNFMDGINGITGIYSLVILLSCWYLNREIMHVVPEAYLIVPMLAASVFLCFNFRKKARCFAGDVGSVSIGFWVISVLLAVILTTGEPKYLFFLSVYGVDAVLTIIHRLILRQNIFEAHRLHFYQILANERKVPHQLVSLAYGAVQLAVNAFVLFTGFNFMITGLIICLPLTLIYVLGKKHLMNTAVI